MYVEDFLRHTGVMGRATASIITHGCWAAVNANKKTRIVGPGDVVSVSIASAAVLELLKLPEPVAAVAAVDDTILFRVDPAG